ncbi:MAG: methylated-DNA--[protein]-cysteine S-methyltransferase [Actinomycetota bacterium]|jgi:methylated-DNA-[protein]-cysteine S-methyltransferase
MSDTLRIPTTDVEEASSRAAVRLLERARRARLEDVAYAEVDTPTGRLLLAATSEGLVRVGFPEEPLDDVLQELADAISPRVLEDPKALERVRRQLDEYFEGRRRTFATPLDWRLAPAGFGRKVLEQTARIPYGAVSTYGEVARRAGSARAARAAGNALHDNPIPIVVPCHRVVPATGGIGKYGGSEWRKEYLLRLEGWLAVSGPPAGPR